MLKTMMTIVIAVIAVLSLASTAEAHRRVHHHAHHFRHYSHRHYQYRGFHHRAYREHHHHRRGARPITDAPRVGDVRGFAGGGLASWYRGRTGGLTAAHRTYPFGTRVLVTNRQNGRSVIVRINDRGPFIRGRVIDLNKPAAVAIGVSGVSPVSMRRL